MTEHWSSWRASRSRNGGRLHRERLRRYDDQAPRWTRDARACAVDGYCFDLVDLRDWRSDREALAARLGGFDVLLLTGGNPYYLRSLMALTGADSIITDLVRQGTVYAGASAAAVVAGPTLRHFDDELDDPGQAEVLIWEGLGLTDVVIAPHVDNPDFGDGCRRAGDLCATDGYPVRRLTDAQSLVIDGIKGATR